MKNFVVLGFALLFLAFPLGSQNQVRVKDSQPQIRLVLLDSPPWVIENPVEGREGYSVELFREVFRRAELVFAPEYLPLARAEAETKRDPRVLCLQLSRIPQREIQYQWVQRVFASGLIFVNKVNKQPVQTLDQALLQGRVTVRSQSAQESFLKEKGFKNLEPVIDDYLAYRLLKAGRVDSWFTMRTRIPDIIAREGGALNQYNLGPRVGVLELYLVAHPHFPAPIIQRIQKAYNEVLTTPFFNQLRQKYEISEE